VVRSGSGSLHVGCNVENASYGATLCAERAAVAAMVAAGQHQLDAVLVFTDDGPLGMPCGICRQTLLEFAASECVVVASSPRETRSTTLSALLPEPFTLSR
jgi:cytidine deaminase